MKRRPTVGNGDVVLIKRQDGNFLHANPLCLDVNFCAADHERLWDVDGEFFLVSHCNAHHPEEEPLRFGDSFHLRHRTTGAWLHQFENTLGLVEAARRPFRVVPCYKSQRNGEVVSTETEVIICGTGLFSHSALFFESQKSEAVMRAFGDDSNTGVAPHPFRFCLSVARGREIPCDDEDSPQQLVLRDRVPIALYHLERQSFLTAHFASPSVHFHSSLDEESLGGTGAWAFETLDAEDRGEQIHFAKTIFRIRHIPTSRYVCAAFPLHGQQCDSGDTVNAVCLVKKCELEKVGIRACFYVANFNNDTAQPWLESAVLIQQARNDTVFTLGDAEVDDDSHHRVDFARLSTKRSDSSSNAIKLCILKERLLLESRKVTTLQFEVVSFNREIVEPVLRPGSFNISGEGDPHRTARACQRIHLALSYTVNFLLDHHFETRTTSSRGDVIEGPNMDGVRKTSLLSGWSLVRSSSKYTRDAFGNASSRDDTSTISSDDDQYDEGDEQVDDLRSVLKQEGMPVASRQHLARELGLMDALMDLTVEFFRGGRHLPSTVHAVAMHALMLCYAECRENEVYAVKYSSGKWFHSLISQLEYAESGAASALTLLVCDNERLLARHIDDKIVDQFVAHINHQGPVSDLLHFLRAVCTCKGVGMRSNQELCLRKLGLASDNELVRNTLLLRICHNNDGSKVSMQKYLRTSSRRVSRRLSRTKSSLDSLRSLVSLGSTKLGHEYLLDEAQSSQTAPCDGKVRALLDFAYDSLPSNFLGHDLFPRFHPCLVTWTWPPHGDGWIQGMDSHLFWSPIDIGVRMERDEHLVVGLPTIRQDAHEWVDLSQLLWVLDRERLALKVLGASPDVVQGAIDSDPKLKIAFERHEQLADYLVAQIETAAELAADRSYNAIHRLEQEYPFSMLSSSMANEMLPLRARAGFAKLMMSLFVDRYPHTKLCSEAKLSHSVHVMTTESTNISRAFHLSDPDQTIADYNGRTPENEAFISFASSDKFFILEAEILHWFQQTQGVLVADDESSNAYTCALLDILSALISFGFCVNVKHQMHKALVMTLDGRSDIHRRKKLMMECRRGVKESRSIHVTKLKALEVLNACHDTTERERLLRFIDLFKAYNVEESFELQQSNLPNDKKDFGQKDDRQLSTTYQQTLLTRFCSQLCRKKSATASIIPEQASAVDRFRTKVEALFFEKEIKSSAECEGDTPPLDWILIDLILCDSDEITAMAFLLLQRFHFGRTRLLRQACSSLLLDAEELNVNGNCCFRTYDDLKSVVQQLRHHVRSYQIWAVSNDFSTAVDHTFRRVNQILADIHNFASIGDENFRLLMSLDVAEVLILVTRFETSLGTTKDAAKMRELVNKVYECFQVFLDLEGKTTGNREGLNKFVGKSVDNSKILLLVQPLGEKLKQEIAFIRKVSDCKWQDFEALDEVETSANLRLLTKYFQVESNRVQATLSIVSLLAAVLRRDHSLIVADSCMFDHLLHMLLADSGFAACLRSRLDLIDIFFVMVDEIDEASVANFVVRQQRCIFLMQVLLKYSAAIETELELSNCIRSDGDESSRILYHVQLVRLLETLTCAATSEQVSKIFPIETLLKNARLAIVGEIQSGLPCQAYISFLAGKLAVHQGEATDTVEVYCQAVEALADFIVRIPEENIRYNDGLVPATMGLIQTLIDTHAIPGSGVERRMLAKQSLIAKQDVANHLMPNCFRQTRFTGQDLPHACASPTSKRRSKHDEQPAHHKRIEFRKQCNVTLKNVMHPPMLERRSNAHIVAVNEKDSTRINFIRALSAIESSCDSDAAKFMETVMNCPYVAFKKVAARLMSFCQRNAGREEHEQTVFDMIKVLTDSLGREPPDNAHSRKLKSKRGTSNNLDEESARRELAKEIFDMIDLDGSGFLDQKEIISAIKLDKTVINYIHACEDRHLQGFCSPKMLLERLSSVDVDQNQKISAEEWIAAAVTPGITLTRRKQSALKLWHRMESRATDIFVVTLSIISVAISIARNASNTQNPTLQVCDFIITCLFTTEVATRMMLWMGLGRSIADYLNDFYRCVDFFVVLVDWLNILLGSTRNRTMITKGLRSVRFVKFIRRFVSLTRSTRIYTHARRVRANPQLLAVRATVAKNKLNHRQNLLAEQGAVSLVFELVATPSTNRRIREQSIKLGSRLLATGFRDNQARLYSIITRKDPDGMFFETLRRILEQGTAALKEAATRRCADNKRREFKEYENDLRDDIDAAFTAIELLLGIVQGSDERLRLALQKHCLNRRSVDLVLQVTEMLEAIVCGDATDIPSVVNFDHTGIICDVRRLVNFLSAMCVCGDSRDRHSIIQSSALCLFSALLSANSSNSASDSKNQTQDFENHRSRLLKSRTFSTAAIGLKREISRKSTSTLFSRHGRLSSSKATIERKLLLRLKIDCVAAIAGLVSAEYRDDGIINHVNACISPNAFDIFSAELLSYVDSAASDEISTSLPVEIQRKAIQDVFIVRLRLSDQCDLAINAPCTVNGTTSPDAYAASVNRKLSKKLLTVEVYWRGRCHIAIFEKPTYAGAGGDGLVKSLETRLRRLTVSERVMQIMAEAPRRESQSRYVYNFDSVAETMMMIWAMTSKNKLYTWIKHHETILNVLLYLLVSALFLLTAIAADRAEDRAESEGSLHYYRELCHMGASPPLRSYFRRYGGEATFFDQQTRRTARLAMLLVALSCIGYSVMLWFAAILAFPPVYTRHKAAFKWYQAAKLEQVLAKLEDEVRGYAERRDAQRDVGDLENKADQRAVGKPTTTATHRQVRRNNSAWLLILLWSLLVLFACAGAVTTYGYDPAFHYVGIIGALLLFPSRLRRWYIAIDTSDAFVYCTAYDFITSDSRIFGRVALLTSIGLGCQLSVDCFAFCLFEILLISEKLQKVLLAVINPFNELAIATYLCVVVIAGFTVLGLLMFNADPDSKIDIDHDRIDFEWDTVEKCASAIDCICLNIYHAFVDGEMVSVTSHVKKNGYGFYSRTPSTKELQRMALQMVCNMTVVLLLLNMIAGIILDAFNQLASKETENSQKRRNECFASGVTRSRCENEEISFEALQASQNILSYIYYHAYISQKTTETDTLTEAHVRSCIANNDMSWIPSMTSWHIERRRQQRDCEQESQDAFANFIKKQEALNSKLEAAIEKLVEQTEENRKMKNLITNISSGETSRERTQESHEHQHFGNDSPMGTAARPPTSNYEIRSPKRLPSPPSHRRDARAPRRRQARILPNLQSTCRLSDFEEA